MTTTADLERALERATIVYKEVFAERKRLREALSQIIVLGDEPDNADGSWSEYWEIDCLNQAKDIARVALAKEAGQ